MEERALIPENDFRDLKNGGDSGEGPLKVKACWVLIDFFIPTQPGLNQQADCRQSCQI